MHVYVFILFYMDDLITATELVQFWIAFEQVVAPIYINYNVQVNINCSFC